MRFGRPLPQGSPRAPYNGDGHRGGREPGLGSGNRGHERDHDHDRGHDRDGDRRHRPYRNGYGPGYSFGYLGWPGYPFLWDSSCFLGCDAADYNGYDTPYGPGPEYGNPEYGVPAANGQNGDAAMQYPGYPAAPSYQNEQYAEPPANDPPAASPVYNVTSPPPPQQPLTVIFKDGRRLQIHNYLLTAKTLTVLDEKYREIPLDQIDVAATRQSNLAEGLDFRVPQGSR